MVIVGAKGHAKEVLQCLKEYDTVLFYDDIDESLLVVDDKFAVLKNLLDVKIYFNVENSFVLGIGNPYFRQKLADDFINQGGVLTSVIADTAIISDSAKLGIGLNIMHFTLIAPGVKVGNGTLLNARVSLHHDVEVGHFCEISPGAMILGRSKVGNMVSIGAGAVILPDIKIGDYAVVGAGAIVTKDVMHNQIVVGVPAKPLKKTI